VKDTSSRHLPRRLIASIRVAGDLAHQRQRLEVSFDVLAPRAGEARGGVVHAHGALRREGADGGELFDRRRRPRARLDLGRPGGGDTRPEIVETSLSWQPVDASAPLVLDVVRFFTAVHDTQ
jgi:hypothetical protein